MAKLAAAVPIFKGIGVVASTLGAIKSLTASKPKIPKPGLPTPVNPVGLKDVSVDTAFGTEADIKNQRVPGRSVARSKKKSTRYSGWVGE